MRQVVALQGAPPVMEGVREIEVTAGMLQKFAERVTEKAGPFQGIQLLIRDGRLYAEWGTPDISGRR